MPRHLREMIFDRAGVGRAEERDFDLCLRLCTDTGSDKRNGQTVHGDIAHQPSSPVPE
jgi:hypothetical protein